MHYGSQTPFRPKFSLLREAPPPRPTTTPTTLTTTTRTVPAPRHPIVSPPTASAVTPTTTTAIPSTPVATTPSTVRRRAPAYGGAHRAVPRYGAPIRGAGASRTPITTPSTTAPTTSQQSGVTTSPKTRSLSETGLLTIDWTNVSKDWKSVQPLPTVSSGEALTPAEMNWMTERGIVFVRRLGSGGFGTVWHVTASRLVKDEQDQFKQVDLACKVVSLSRFAPRPGKVREFDKAVQELLHETDIHHRLSHENIVKCEEVLYLPHATTGFPLMRILLFMELMDGDLEAAMLTRFGSRFGSDADAFSWFHQICDGLAYLHGLDITHFDIKVVNIMFKKVGTNRVVYKLSDFGLSRRFDSGDQRYNKPIGTRTYHPPEMKQLSAGKDFLAKPVDIYCLGLALVESISSTIFRTTMMAALNSRWDRPAERRWGVSADCVKLILKMLDNTPDKRPTIEEVQQDPWYIRMSANLQAGP